MPAGTVKKTPQKPSIGSDTGRKTKTGSFHHTKKSKDTPYSLFLRF
jgi:hypothetical protein